MRDMLGGYFVSYGTWAPTNLLTLKKFVEQKLYYTRGRGQTCKYHGALQILFSIHIFFFSRTLPLLSISNLLESYSFLLYRPVTTWFCCLGCCIFPPFWLKSYGCFGESLCLRCTLSLTFISVAWYNFLVMSMVWSCKFKHAFLGFSI